MIRAGNLDLQDEEATLFEEVRRVTEWVNGQSAQKFVHDLVSILTLLNRLSGYFQYQEIHEEHLLEIVNYRVNQLVQHQGMPTIIMILERETLLDKFEIIFQKSDDYLMKRRRKDGVEG
jgi:hypothetical protein